MVRHHVLPTCDLPEVVHLDFHKSMQHKQITLADRFAMLAVARPRSDTFGSAITVQAAGQDSAEFKILAMRSWWENELP